MSHVVCSARNIPRRRTDLQNTSMQIAGKASITAQASNKCQFSFLLFLVNVHMSFHH